MANRKAIVGIVLGGMGLFGIFVGVALGVWASSHSPNMGVWERLNNPNNYIINQPYYTIIMLVAWGGGLVGTALAVLGGSLFVFSLVRKEVSR
ncbi:MAG: hypothetical protein L0229_27540 [Blastocatellia bacterium]|nr:hypothetical protein [Blastocatellia bacterium]